MDSQSYQFWNYILINLYSTVLLHKYENIAAFPGKMTTSSFLTVIVFIVENPLETIS